MITMEGPDWAYLEPDEIHLGGEEEGVLYLYLSPGFGTNMDTYTVNIEADSGRASDSLDVAVIVPEDITDVELPEPPEEPEEPEEPGNVSINVTHPEEPTGNETGPITGGAVEERPFWKTAAVALIALIIIAILVLRFVLLLRK